MRPGARLFGELERGDQLVSLNQRFRLVHHDDGNVTLWQVAPPVLALWHTKTWKTPSTRLVMQVDGNLVLYGTTGPLFATGTWGNPYAYACLQDDGNFVIYTVDDF